MGLELMICLLQQPSAPKAFWASALNFWVYKQKNFGTTLKAQAKTLMYRRRCPYVYAPMALDSAQHMDYRWLPDCNTVTANFLG